MRPVRLARPARRKRAYRPQIVQMQRRRVRGHQQRLRGQRVHDRSRVCLARARVEGGADLGDHLPRGGCRDLEEPVGARGVEDWWLRGLVVAGVEDRARKRTFAIAAVCERATAAFVSPGAPFGLYCASAGGEDAGVAILVVAVAASGREAEGLDMPAREPDCEDGLGRMESLGKELRGERKGAYILKHLCYRGIAQ